MTKNKKSRLIIVGGGGFAHEVASWANDCYAAGRLPVLTGYIDDTNRGLVGNGAPYLGTIADYIPLPNDELLLGIGDPSTKKKLVNLLQSRGARFSKLIHPTAVIGANCHHDEGVVICPMAMNTASTRMGPYSTLLTFSGLGHDAVLGAFSTVSSHVDIMGHASVGDEVFIGSGARVMPRVTVGNGARIGANVVAQRNVKAGLTLYSLPAKNLKMNLDRGS